MVTANCKLSKGSTKFVGWNVLSLNSQLKQGKVYAHLKTFKADIYFLQETNIKTY